MSINSTTLKSYVGFQIKQTQQFIFQRFSVVLKQFNITPSEVSILLLVHDNPNISQVTLAKAIGVERASFGEALNKLEAKGMIERSVSAEDRREKNLSIPAGKKIEFRAILSALHEYNEKLTSELSSNETKTLIKLLEKIRQAD